MNSFRTRVLVALTLAFAFTGSSLVVPGDASVRPAAAATVAPRVVSATEGDTPFVGEVTVSGIPRSMSTVTFEVRSKTGAVSVPVRATFSRRYLTQNNHFTTASTLVLPVFGLYENYTNSIAITVSPSKGRAKTVHAAITTSRWDNGCRNTLVRADKVVPATSGADLDFSFFMLKAWACDAHPIVMDIDGNLRWTGTAGSGEQGSAFFRNTFFLGGGSDLYAMTPFGESSTAGNYYDDGYETFHHNIDPGRDGLLLEFNKYPDVESDVIEVAANGNILHEWDVADIVRQAMIDGGDDPSNFVRQGDDWFHNNAATYWKEKNQLVLSGREDFVIGIGYDDHEIKWILGDPDKAWYTYPSLRAFALELPEGTNPPIGQHAVSFTSSGNLMLFDNGFESFAHSPAGYSRSESVPRQYSLNLKKRIATEVWRYDHTSPVWSPICSSIYQFGTSYLIDYASEDGGIRLVGIDKRKNIGFEWKIDGAGYDWGWNALPIDFAGMRFR